jgi:hypothetical protein
MLNLLWNHCVKSHIQQSVNDGIHMRAKEQLYLPAMPAADGMQTTRAKPKYSKKIVLVPMQ